MLRQAFNSIPKLASSSFLPTYTLIPLVGLGNAAFGSSTFVRTMMKTHRGCYKRWMKTGSGYKRGRSGRKHGNTGWGGTLLGQHTGTIGAKGKGHGDQTKKLKRLLPYI